MAAVEQVNGELDTTHNPLPLPFYCNICDKHRPRPSNFSLSLYIYIFRCELTSEGLVCFHLTEQIAWHIYTGTEGPLLGHSKPISCAAISREQNNKQIVTLRRERERERRNGIVLAKRQRLTQITQLKLTIALANGRSLSNTSFTNTSKAESGFFRFWSKRSSDGRCEQVSVILRLINQFLSFSHSFSSVEPNPPLSSNSVYLLPYLTRPSPQARTRATVRTLSPAGRPASQPASQTTATSQSLIGPLAIAPSANICPSPLYLSLCPSIPLQHTRIICLCLSVCLSVSTEWIRSAGKRASEQAKRKRRA